MAQRKAIKTLGSFLALIFLFSIILCIPLACAANHSPSEAMLDSGPFVNTKIKALAISTDPEREGKAYDIKAIRMADSLPDYFIPSDANTVSMPYSKYPIYIFFDNSNDAGIVFFYTEAETITMNGNSRYMFSNLTALTDISGLADWNTSNVQTMCGLFSNTKSLPDALALQKWNTSNVSLFWIS